MKLSYDTLFVWWREKQRAWFGKFLVALIALQSNGHFILISLENMKLILLLKPFPDCLCPDHARLLLVSIIHS
ncbi:MAG: hypothetical protein UX74_C0038G0006, partial [Parcubacteria group bacterium GW2011_GWA2_47_10b]